MNIYQSIAENIYRPFHRYKILNEEKLIIDSPTIFIINHQSVSEPTVIYRAIREHCGVNARFLGMAELFRIPIIGNFVKALDFIPVERGSKNAAKSLEAAMEYMKNNNNPVLALYPEGDLSKDRNNLEIRPFKSGAARIALSTPNVKIIPVAQIGTRPGKLQLFKNLYQRPLIRIKFGEPITPNEEFSTDFTKFNALLREKLMEYYEELK